MRFIAPGTRESSPRQPPEHVPESANRREDTPLLIRRRRVGWSEAVL